MEVTESGGMLGGPHVINFQYDDDMGCEVTVLCHGVRFHIMVELSQLQGKGRESTGLVEEYKRLIKAVDREEEEEEEGLTESDLIKRKDMEEAQKHDPEAEVASAAEQESLDSDGGTDNVDRYQADSGEEDNSAYATGNVSAHEGKVGSDSNSLKSDSVSKKAKPYAESGPGEEQENAIQGSDNESSDGHDAQGSLQKFVLAPFQSTFRELAPSAGAPMKPTLHDYYHTKVFFFTLTIKSGALTPFELKETTELSASIAHLVPQMDVPKYIRNMKMPWVSSHDVRVLSESDNPAPVHPAKVIIGDEIKFLKLVDAAQPSTTKRELQLLAKIERLGLCKKMKVPKLLGLVGNGNSRTNIMGFILTDIGDVTPLTARLDPNVPAALREKWSHNVEEMVELLHKNGLVWGDAKADNLLVDAKDELWMIDFGGSYTDGWIEPELRETGEGDDQGLDKIVSALKDPVANTFEHCQTTNKEEEKGRFLRRTGDNSLDKVHDTRTRKRKRERLLEEVQLVTKKNFER